MLGVVLSRREPARPRQAPPPPRPTVFLASFGPADGPLRFDEQPPTIGVFARSAQGPRVAYPIGVAHSTGWIPYKGVAAGTFRLVLGRDELDGRWVCDCRRFVRVEGAE